MMDSQPKETGLSTASKAMLIVAGTIAAALVLAFVVKNLVSGGDLGPDRAVFAVRRGTLEVRITETGELQAAESIRITPEIKGQATIIELVDEGTRARKGDIIVKLDATDLEQREASQAIEVENAQASLIKAKEEKKIQELTNETDISRSKLAVSNARMDTAKYGTVIFGPGGYLHRGAYGLKPLAEEVRAAYARSDSEDGQEAQAPVEIEEPAAESAPTPDAPPLGEAYQKFRDAELAIVRAQTDVARAEEDFRDLDQLLEKGFITRNDYIADQLQVEEAKRKLESALLAYDILKTYTYPKEIAQLKADLKKAEDELAKSELSAASQVTQKTSAIAQAEAVYNMRKTTLDDTRDQLAKMIITAPEDGLVLYGDERRPWEKDEIQVGGRAFEGRTLITFPSVANMVAATKVLEKDVYKVLVDQTATVTLPALKGVVLSGKVARVSSVASSGQRWMTSSESKTFDVEVILDQSDERMKPGMSCQADILVAIVEDCLYVPVNAVFREDGKDTVRIVEGSKVSSRRVLTGEGNDIYVSIKEGLEEGEEVLLYKVPLSDLGEGAEEASGDETSGEFEGAPAYGPGEDERVPEGQGADARAPEGRGSGGRPGGFEMTEEMLAGMLKRMTDAGMSEEEAKGIVEAMKAGEMTEEMRTRMREVMGRGGGMGGSREGGGEGTGRGGRGERGGRGGGGRGAPQGGARDGG